MKRIILRFVVLAACAAVHSGCTHEDKSNCPGNNAENVMISFTMTDAGGADVFAANVEKVAVFVFNSEGRYYADYVIDKAHLASYQGASLTLPAGQYSFVFWANTDTRTRYGDMTAAESIAASWLGHTGSDSCDPLYFAPSTGSAPQKRPTSLSLTVSPGLPARATADFMCAHKTIDVFVENFTTTRADAHKIAVSNIYRGYSFTMNALTDSPIDFEQQARTVTSPEGVTLTNATFNTTNFGSENNIVISLKRMDGTVGRTVRLNDFAGENNIDLTKTDYIPILIRFLNGSVEITLPGWGGKPIKPELR